MKTVWFAFNIHSGISAAGVSRCVRGSLGPEGRQQEAGWQIPPGSVIMKGLVIVDRKDCCNFEGVAAVNRTMEKG